MPRPPMFSPVLICLLAIGLAGGAAATFVVSPTRPFVSTGSVPYLIPGFYLGILLLVPIVAGVAVIVLQRLRGGGKSVSLARGILPVLVVFILLVAFAELGPFLKSGGPWVPNSSAPSHTPVNNTTQPNGTNNHTNGTSNGSTPGLAPEVIHVPGWVLFLVAAAVGLGVLGVMIPASAGWLVQRRSARSAAAAEARRAATTAALTQALAELETGAGPREVIERLYGRFLARVAPLAGDLIAQTPDEIRRGILLPLGVRPEAAVALTRLFEEARYSSHPMDAGKANGVRQAIDVAVADLNRYSPTR